jgi:hypothetical protein
LQLAGAQLWPTLHHALFAHAVCAEHGELVHVSAHTAHLDRTPQEPSPAWTPAAGGDDAHDHCKLPPGTHEPAAEPSSASALVSASPRLAASPLAHDDELTRPIAILSLAPKQSPPSR